jgi:hypothetical protein
MAIEWAACVVQKEATNYTAADVDFVRVADAPASGA